MKWRAVVSWKLLRNFRQQKLSPSFNPPALENKQINPDLPSPSKTVFSALNFPPQRRAAWLAPITASASQEKLPGIITFWVWWRQESLALFSAELWFLFLHNQANNFYYLVGPLEMFGILFPSIKINLRAFFANFCFCQLNKSFLDETESSGLARNLRSRWVKKFMAVNQEISDF